MYAIFLEYMNWLPTSTHSAPLWPLFLRPGDIGCVRRPLAFGTIVLRGIPTIVGNAVQRCRAGASGGIFE